MRGKTLLSMVAAAVAILLVHSQAQADLSPGFDMYNTSLSYKAKTKTISITAHYQTLAPDGSYVTGKNARGHVTMRLKMSQDAEGTWNVAGTYSLKSSARHGVKASGSYSSALVSLDGGVLNLRGDASGMKWANPTLDPKTGLWKMPTKTLTSDAGGVSPGTSDMAYLMLKFTVPYGTMDDMLLKSRRAKAGAGSISAVPAPAAVVMGLVGLGLLGWRMRRYA